MRLTVSLQTHTGQLGHFSKNQLKFNKLIPPATFPCSVNKTQLSASPAPVGGRHSRDGCLKQDRRRTYNATERRFAANILTVEKQ